MVSGTQVYRFSHGLPTWFLCLKMVCVCQIKGKRKMKATIFLVCVSPKKTRDNLPKYRTSSPNLEAFFLSRNHLKQKNKNIVGN